MANEKKELSNEELLKLMAERGLIKEGKTKDYVVEENTTGSYDLVYPDFRLNGISTSSSHAERYNGYIQKIQQAARRAGYQMKFEKIEK